MILELADIKHVGVKSKVTNDATYIDDAVVRDMYYYPLAERYGVPVANLPDDSAINAKVKRYLVLSVYVTVANDSIGVTMQQVVENVSVDVWNTNKTSWIKQLEILGTEITAENIYDASNPPIEEEVNHPNVMTWGRR